MDEEAKDALRERNRRRANCSRCGGPCVLKDGADFGPLDDDHFAGITYKVCTACGHEAVVKRARK